MSNHNRFIADGELLLKIAALTRNGWTFEFDEGEAKFESSTIVAKKGDIVKVFYESNDIYQILRELEEQ